MLCYVACVYMLSSPSICPLQKNYVFPCMFRNKLYDVNENVIKQGASNKPKYQMNITKYIMRFATKPHDTNKELIQFHQLNNPVPLETTTMKVYRKYNRK